MLEVFKALSIHFHDLITNFEASLLCQWTTINAKQRINDLLTFEMLEVISM